MKKESNNANAASQEDSAAEIHDDAPKGPVQGSLAPHALPSEEELAPEDLAVLPGHGQGGFSKRLVPAAAVLALLALGVYSLTRGGASEPPPEEPQAAAQPAAAEPPAAAATVPPKAKQEPVAPDEASDEAPHAGIPMMMPPATTDTVEDDAMDPVPFGPSVGRFPDLPPSVISYLKTVEGAASDRQSAPDVPETTPPADAP